MVRAATRPGNRKPRSTRISTGVPSNRLPTTAIEPVLLVRQAADEVALSSSAADFTAAVQTVYDNIPPVSVVQTAGDYAVTASDYAVLDDASGGPATVALPAAATVSGQTFVIEKTDVSANAVTIAAHAGETIAGAATKVLAAQYASARLTSDGVSGWVEG